MTEDPSAVFADAAPAPEPVVPEKKATAKKTAKKAPAKKAAATPPGSRRGRPRPESVVSRDDQVLAAVTKDGLSREALAEATGLDPTRVYQSLWRLRRDGKVERVRDGREHTWRLVG